MVAVATHSLPCRHELETNINAPGSVNLGLVEECLNGEDRVLFASTEQLCNNRYMSFKVYNGCELEMELLVTSPDDSCKSDKRRLRLSKNVRILPGIWVFDRPLASKIDIVFATNEGVIYKIALKYGVFFESLNDTENWLQVYCLRRNVTFVIEFRLI